MNKKKYKFLIMPLVMTTFAMLTFTACTKHVPEVPMTQLQKREIQTREFDTNDTKLVMKAMMHVLQDDGFVIKNAVLDLGLLSAEINVNIENKTQMFLAALANSNGGQARWNKQEMIEASANVSEFGGKTRIRMNFQRKTIDNMGCPVDVQTILDSHVYQTFFNKVDKSLFIQNENI